MAFTWGNIERVFQSQAVHDQFQKEGHIVRRMLSPELVERMLEVYHRLHPDPQAGFYATTFNLDPAHRRGVHAEILEHVRPSLQEIFQDFKVYFCSFITKAPGKKSELILHQDMTLLDEARFNGINCWCPLVDLNENNGAIRVLPGSHRIRPTYRGSSLPDIYDGLEKEVISYMEPQYLRAGEAVIFDQSIMHYSPSNETDQVRPVINVFVSHESSGIRIAYKDPEGPPNKIELFEQNDEFLFEYQKFGRDIFSRPDIGTSLGLEDYEFEAVTRELLAERYGPLRLEADSEA